MTDYQGNTHKGRMQESPPEKPPVEKVVTGEVVQKKRTFGQKLKAVFFGGEFKGAMRYITADVLLPTIRNLVVDSTTEGIKRMVYGESVAQRRRPSQYGSRIQYNAPVQRGRPYDHPYLPDQQPHRPVMRQRREASALVLSTREEAENVLERLIDIVDKYNVASVADLHDLTGLPTSYIDNKWGWTYLNNAEIRQVREGYLLDLPPAEEI